MDEALANMEKDYEVFGNLYAEAESHFRNLGGYQLEAKAHGILRGLGFSEEPLRPILKVCLGVGGCELSLPSFLYQTQTSYT